MAKTVDLPVTFASFVISLASSAMLHLGEIANPETTYHTSQIIDGFSLELNTDTAANPAPSKIKLVPMEGWARHLSALCAIDPECDYDTWFKVATVLHPWGETGLQTFIAWSQASTKHNPTEQEITDGECGG